MCVCVCVRERERERERRMCGEWKGERKVYMREEESERFCPQANAFIIKIN